MHGYRVTRKCIMGKSCFLLPCCARRVQFCSETCNVKICRLKTCCQCDLTLGRWEKNGWMDLKYELLNLDRKSRSQYGQFAQNRALLVTGSDVVVVVFKLPFHPLLLLLFKKKCLLANKQHKQHFITHTVFQLASYHANATPLPPHYQYIEGVKCLSFHTGAQIVRCIFANFSVCTHFVHIST